MKKYDKAIREIKREIKHYNVRESIANAMIKLGEKGFEFSGHGIGLGGEDFSLVSEKISLVNEKIGLHVTFCDKGRSCEVTVESVFTGTIKKAFNFIDKI